MKNTITLKVWTFVLIVLIAIGLIVASVFITKSVCDSSHKESDQITKWGININFTKKPDYVFDAREEQVETADELSIRFIGNARCPEPGKQIINDYNGISGIAERNITADYTGEIKFPENSYMVNNQFYCPLIFDLGLDSNGEPIVVNGNDYIGNKDGLEKGFKDAADKLDIARISTGTNLKESAAGLSRIVVVYPDNKGDIYEQIKDSTFSYNLGFSLKAI